MGRAGTNASTEADVDFMYTMRIDNGKGFGSSMRMQALISSMAELYAQTKIPKRGFIKEDAGPNLPCGDEEADKMVSER
jgi:hypothetical protein